MVIPAAKTGRDRRSNTAMVRTDHTKMESDIETLWVGLYLICFRSLVHVLLIPLSSNNIFDGKSKS